MFLPRCSLTSEEVRRYYMNGGPEAHESTGIIFVETQVWSQGLQGVWRWGEKDTWVRQRSPRDTRLSSYLREKSRTGTVEAY